MKYLHFYRIFIDLTQSINKSNIENFRKGYNNLESLSLTVTHLSSEDLYDKINLSIENKLMLLGN